MRKTGIASIDRDLERLKAIQERSDKAQGLVGKLLQIQKADGYAYYTVEEEKGAKVRVSWHDVLDAWQDDILGQGGWFARKLVEPLIRAQEGFRKIMDDHGRKSDREYAKRRESVVKAAVADLGRNADVYDLAYWVWSRADRSGKPDPRIYTSEIAGTWANDLAHDLIESKQFPALLRLANDYDFTRLCESHEDPRIYRNPPPHKGQILAMVAQALVEQLGAAPDKLDLLRIETERLTSAVFAILAGPSLKTVGKVWYEPKDGRVIQVKFEFEKDFRK